ncbi:MAG TPA: cytochrome b/b6 domain-containing protein, partial [Caulobacteraceae bacterium]|nr:cytochrome b/b6 domain-containing protein [Caulobacteraceae bacterium]
MTRTRYTTVAIVLHWAIAALIVANLYLGWRMGFLKGLAQFNLFQLHKSIGVTILLLSVLRLAWRLA